MARIWNDVAAYLAKTCPEHGASFRDFRDPTTFGGDINGFWDGQHMFAENDRRMINVLFGLPPEKLARDFPEDLTLLKSVEKPASKRNAGAVNLRWRLPLRSTAGGDTHQVDRART